MEFTITQSIKCRQVNDRTLHHDKKKYGGGGHFSWHIAKNSYRVVNNTE